MTFDWSDFSGFGEVMHEICDTGSAISGIRHALEASNLVYGGLVCEWNEIYVGLLFVSW